MRRSKAHCHSHSGRLGGNRPGGRASAHGGRPLWAIVSADRTTQDEHALNSLTNTMATPNPNQDLRHTLLLSAICTLARVLPEPQRCNARAGLVNRGSDLLRTARLSDQLDAQLASYLSLLLDALGG